jgi:3-methylcrotonyl-CoA carboxylase beta subunit
VSAEELGGADVHCKISGVTDHLALSDPHALQIARRIVANLNRKKSVSVSMAPVEEPRYSADELNGIIPVRATPPPPCRSDRPQGGSPQTDRHAQNHRTRV